MNTQKRKFTNFVGPSLTPKIVNYVKFTSFVYQLNPTRNSIIIKTAN